MFHGGVLKTERFTSCDEQWSARRAPPNPVLCGYVGLRLRVTHIEFRISLMTPILVRGLTNVRLLAVSRALLVLPSIH
jgi:hypothetical protein